MLSVYVAQQPPRTLKIVVNDNHSHAPVQVKQHARTFIAKYGDSIRCLREVGESLLDFVVVVRYLSNLLLVAAPTPRKVFVCSQLPMRSIHFLAYDLTRLPSMLVLEQKNFGSHLLSHSRPAAVRKHVTVTSVVVLTASFLFQAYKRFQREPQLTAGDQFYDFITSPLFQMS